MRKRDRDTVDNIIVDSDVIQNIEHYPCYASNTLQILIKKTNKEIMKSVNKY